MRNILLRGILLTFAVPLAVGAYIGILELSGNFHEVLAGQLYRSSQPSGKQLASYVAANGIKTVINLRGENDDAEWYRSETNTAKKLGVTHIDFGMSARSELDLARVAQLIQIMKDAPKPILIHCRAGADRTGLASAIYLNRVAGLDENTAEHQLSIRFGHLSIPYLSSAYAMDRSWENIESVKTITGMLEQPGSTTSDRI